MLTRHYPNPYDEEDMESTFRGIKFTDQDVLNREDWIPAGEYNPHNIHPWLIHDTGFVLCVVFADCLQDALDLAVNEDKLDRYMIDDLDDYTNEDGEESGIDYLGNASEPFDIQSLGVEEMPNPPASFCAQFNAAGMTS